VSEEEFKVVREEWNEYELLDGGRIRTKNSVQKIYRVLDADGKPALTPEGDPQVVISSTNQVTASE